MLYTIKPLEWKHEPDWDTWRAENGLRGEYRIDTVGNLDFVPWDGPSSRLGKGAAAKMKEVAATHHQRRLGKYLTPVAKVAPHVHDETVVTILPFRRPNTEKPA